MTELMAEAEYMKNKKSLKFENLRIHLAAEVAKSKARVKILETPSKVPDDAQATRKSETSYLDQLQRRARNEREDSEKIRTRFHAQEKRKM